MSGSDETVSDTGQDPIDPASEVRTEWRVTWFPPDVAVRHRTAKSYEAAMQLAEEYKSFAPMIEERRVIVRDWRIVWNSLD